MTNNNRKTKKKKFPFNTVDVIIALIMLFCVAYIMYVPVMGNSLYNIGAEKVTIEYEIEIDSKNISHENYKNFRIGDAVKTNDGAHTLGKVVAKYSNADGSVNVVIKSEAFLRKDVYKIDGLRIYKNAELNIRFPNFAPKDAVKCISIKVV